jgi:anti-sigma B factor antagonist
MSANRRIDVLASDGIALVRFVDRKIVDTATIEELGDELSALVEKDNQLKLILNFSNVEFLSSAALNKLIILDRKVKARSGKMKLCHMRKEIHDVLIITRLNILLDVRPTESDAITAIKA